MKFYINQNATLPLLVVSPVLSTRVNSIEVNNQLENAAITFSMIDSKGKYVIAHKSASLLMRQDCDGNDVLSSIYNIYYKFTEQETSIPGMYRGQFKIDFFTEVNNPRTFTGGLILPISQELEIIINPSFIKTTII